MVHAANLRFRKKESDKIAVERKNRFREKKGLILNIFYQIKAHLLFGESATEVIFWQVSEPGTNFIVFCSKLSLAIWLPAAKRIVCSSEKRNPPGT